MKRRWAQPDSASVSTHNRAGRVGDVITAISAGPSAPIAGTTDRRCPVNFVPAL